MKNVAVFFALMFFLTSCSEEKVSTVPDEPFAGNWRLIEIGGTIPNSLTSGDDMEWQESYSFFSHGSFTKSSERNGLTTEIEGTYEVLEGSEGAGVKLTYDSESEIIGSCSGNLTETLHLESVGRLISDWRACDGPFLLYAKLIPVD